MDPLEDRMEDSLASLRDAVRQGDIALARSILDRRPELARMEIDNITVLHHAVLACNAELTSLLMQHGANARMGMYPHSDATSSLAIATERGYEEIAGIILDEEQRRRDRRTGAPGLPPPDALFEALSHGDDARAVAILEAQPALLHSINNEGLSPLHFAAWTLNEPLTRWMLEHGADANARGRNGWTPLDAASARVSRYVDNHAGRFAAVATLLRQHGAALSPWSAAALGDADWLRRCHLAGALPAPVDGMGGLLRVAVTHDNAGILTLLLDLGVDPDERVRAGGIESEEYSWGFPLWECAATGKHALAEILLARGADPNAQVYASGSPVSEAYGQRDWEMIRLLERHGGVADAGLAALYRQTELAKRLIREAPDPRQAALGMLGNAACGGDPELLGIALEYADFARDDPRWYGLLEQPLRVWNHGPGHWSHHEWDRSTYLACFRMILERCDPNVRGRGPDRGQFGLTILHSVAGARPHVTADERLAFATTLLDAGARLDLRDNILRSTPLGWACRWGRVELVKLFLARGADPAEPDAEPWATPLAWAEKKGHAEVAVLLRAAQP